MAQVSMEVRHKKLLNRVKQDELMAFKKISSGACCREKINS